MADEWYYTENGEQRGPIPLVELKERAASGRLARSELVWTEGMGNWQTASDVRGIFDEGPVVISGRPPAPPDVSSKKLTAGICAIVLGNLGVHKFILGYTTQGVILLVLCLVTCGIASAVTSVIGIIEGIIYLTKSDEEFYQTYMVGKKEWF